MRIRGFIKELRFQALIGALLLHIALFGFLLTWRPSILPGPPDIIPIVLIELSSEVLEITPVADAEIETDPPPVLAEPETIPDFIPDSEPRPEPVEVKRIEDVSQPEQNSAPPQEPFETELASEPAAPSGVTFALSDETEKAASQAANPDIPPQYIYKFDPFAETAPTALARSVVAINCSRANRETRPDFCPNYDEDDLFLAGLSQNRPSAWGQTYDPVGDIAVARAELGASEFQKWQAKQLKPEEIFADTPHPFDPILPDKDCRRVPVGFNDPFALDKNAAVPENTAVFCYQSLAD